MAIKKVLIVDDSKTELMFLTDLLQKNGYLVRTAENADDAFKRLTEEKPELILMDVVMPGQNGFQLTRSINRTPEYSDIPISFVPARTWRLTGCGACARARVTTSPNRWMPLNCWPRSRLWADSADPWRTAKH